MTGPARAPSEVTPEQAKALEMLFAAHFDRDPLRIAAAMEHLEFLADIQGLQRVSERAA